MTLLLSTRRLTTKAIARWQILVLGVFLLTILTPPPGTSAADWEVSGYQYRKTITISHTNVDADLHDFPLLVKFTADADIGSHARSDGHDLRFTSSTGALLSYERESFTVSNGSGSGIFWVKVPSISSSADTTIYAYYGKSDASDGQQATSVWDSNYKGVWHLKETGNGASGDYKDSTSNANNSINTAQQPAVSTSGKIGNAENFAGTTYIDLGTRDSLNISSAITLESWVDFTSTTASVTLFGGWEAGRTPGYGWRFNQPSAGKFTFWNGSGWAENNTALNDGTWHHIVVSDGASTTFFLDGETNGTSNQAGAVAWSGDRTIGADGNNWFSSNYIGLADEIRISNSARSAPWIKFEYQNTASGTNEISWGKEGGNPSSWAILLVNTEAFQTIDDADAASDLSLKFGEVLNKSLSYSRSLGSFQFNDDLAVTGNINATGTMSASGSLSVEGAGTFGSVVTAGNMTLNSQNAAQDAVITFGNSQGAETLKFLNAEQRFEFSNGVRIPGALMGSGSLSIDGNAVIHGTLSGTTITSATLQNITLNGASNFISNIGTGSLALRIRQIHISMNDVTVEADGADNAANVFTGSETGANPHEYYVIKTGESQL